MRCRRVVEFRHRQTSFFSTFRSDTVLAMDPTLLSIKELKELIRGANMSYEGLFEKSELVELAKKAIARIQASSNSSRLPATICGLRCHISAIPVRVERVVILLHGLGANERQFDDFFFRDSRWNPDGTTVWISPKSPAEGWFPIALEEFQMALMQGRLAAKLNETPPHLLEARARLANFVREVKDLLGLDSMRRVVLGGFSQGAILAMDVALHLDENVGGVLFFSGFPVALQEWNARMPKHEGLIVLMTHGRLDFVLPVFGAVSLSDTLTKHGLDVKFIQHAGGHDLGDARAMEEARSFYLDRIAPFAAGEVEKD